MIRSSGHMWGPDGKEADTLAVIPDSSYAGVYQVVIDDCRAHGAFDPATMGSVPNVGLMAQAAEEYGSHDKTFEIPADGTVRVVDDSGTVVLAAGGGCRRHLPHVPDQGRADPRLGQARREPRPRQRRSGRVLARRESRPRRRCSSRRSRPTCPSTTPTGCRSRSCRPNEATAFSLERIRRGENTISVTGNVLRDYLTDLFPILELGTSAKMLSIVPLINGGGLFETGAGGSAPKHVQQLLKENYLRWDSLGEFLALAVSFEHLAQSTGNERAQILADTLDRATGTFLERGQVTEPQPRWHRQPRQPLLPGSLLGPGARRSRPTDAELADAFAVLAKTLVRTGAGHRRRAHRRPGFPDRHRWLLPARPIADGGRHAAVQDLQRGTGDSRLTLIYRGPSHPIFRRGVRLPRRHRHSSSVRRRADYC